ncbi:MAG: DJ-1/PfpI family protein [Candidatus Binatia bacterium]|nr:DJ-1/PfpI family protein [Candidatus Binatia bacterium]
MALFPRFELLDVFGPLEMFGYVPNLEIALIAAAPGPVSSTQGPAIVAEHSFEAAPPLDILLVPGGLGTRALVDDADMVSWIAARGAATDLVLSVCTGAALLARAGLLDGRRATSNKRAFGWVVEQGPDVQWVKEARWVWDEKFVTSSGVAAGIDMTLAVIAHLCGEDFAQSLANQTEYDWQCDSDRDPFARIHGLVDGPGTEHE